MNIASICSSHMVFAAGKPIRVFGRGTGTARISFAGITRTVISKESKWCTEFPPMQYGGPYTMTVSFKTETIKLEDIFIGEVFLFAGQSNMQFKMGESDAALDNCKSDGRLRLFSADRIEDTDFFKAKDGWVICQKEQIKYWSAVASLTSRNIAEQTNIAVGAIACYQGASVIESWLPKGSCEKLGINIPTEQKHADHLYPEYRLWNSDGTLYEFALPQIAPFSLSAAVWYQGESDTFGDEAKIYHNELKELIKVWRNDFKNSLLPFIVVQLADFAERNDNNWALIQQAQLKIQDSAENVKTVIAADVCEDNDIHPKSKDKLSDRIAKQLISFLHA